ncbi:GD22770 [Drosophila simulans]|uniref:GD22770 n=1 Tax=Drosophila simulans TaxID=7240 RepID=B4Q947_DROSI|nr:GD22770 [Drosophila simulans]
MQRHAEGHGHLWQKQAISLNEQQEGLKTDKQPPKQPAAQGATPAQGAVAIAITTSPDSDEKPSTSGRVAGIAGISGTNAMRCNNGIRSSSCGKWQQRGCCNCGKFDGGSNHTISKFGQAK